MTLTIRRYESSDRDAVVELHRIALDLLGVYAEDRSVDADLNHIEEVYLQSGDFMVGFYDGRLVAMGALRRTRADRAEIKRMRVHPDYQRRGFGQAILDALEQRARELGYKELHLDTTVQQTAAQRFYEKNGYVMVREGKIGQFDCLFYEKTLVP